MADYNELRDMTIEALKRLKNSNPLQFDYVWREVCNIASERKITLKNEGYGTDYDDVNEVIQELIRAGIVLIGYYSPNKAWPFLRLSRHGKKVIDQFNTSAYDPQGYSESLKRQVPGIDEVIVRYALEGANCFRQGLHMAAAVMIGGASEKAVYLLLESIKGALQDPNEKDFIDKRLTTMSKILDYIEKKIGDLIKNKVVDRDVHQDSMSHINSILDNIRVQRNSAAHPKLLEINEERVLHMMTSLPGTLAYVYRFIGWFDARPNQI